MFRINEFVDWAHHCLKDNDEAQQYLLGRGISESQWSCHRIGYVGGMFDADPIDDSKHGSICKEQAHRYAWCDTCRYRFWSSVWEDSNQLIGKRIEGSVVFPLTTYSKQVVGIQTRSIKEKSYDTFAVSYRPEGYFFGTSMSVDSIWTRKEVYLVEGAPDHLILERLVSPNILALTTSSVNKLQLRFLKRFVNKVNLCLDLDSAGRHGVKTFFEYNADDFEIRNIKYPALSDASKDLSDFWRIAGDDKFRRYFNAQR